ncbi:MAG: GGDEF domain-containing protein [Desulfotalea sp.]
MKSSELTLLDQLRITKREIVRRKEYISLGPEDCEILASLRDLVAENIDEIIIDFYAKITSFSEMDELIGDAETLRRLQNHQRNYILSLFDGQYDEDYVHSRLRVGVVHKRIGVDPKYYISSIYILEEVLGKLFIENQSSGCDNCKSGLSAIKKILMFDLSLAIDTYVNSLVTQVNRSQSELEEYAESLEEIVSERTKLLREQARHDGLTNLLNQHSFYTELRRELLRSSRGNHSTVLVYFDLDNFKNLNDTQGHKRGDEILVAVADAMRATLRDNEISARYGGDEFCIIMPESTIEDAKQACKRLCSEIKKSIEGSGVTCSMGIAVSLADKPSDANSLVKKADKAMYKAKKVKGFAIKIAN